MLAVWAADCAERTLPLFERRAPADPRPREAIDHASPAVRDILRRLPPPPRAAGTLGALIDDLHRSLTAGR